MFRRKICPFADKPFDSLSYYYIRSAGGYTRYTMLDVSSWSESVTNRRPSTLKWGVELGPGARRDAYPSESDKKLRS